MTKIAKRVDRVSKSISKWWDENCQDMVDSTLNFIAYTFALITFIGVVFYIFLRIVKADAQPIEMATVRGDLYLCNNSFSRFRLLCDD